MKRLVPALVPLLAATAAGHENHPPEDSEVPLGIEVVTGYRSEYVFRGFSLGHQVLEVQLQAELALSDHWLLDLGAWYAGATGSGDFSEAAGFVDLAYQADLWEAGLAVTGHAWDHSLFRDGVDIAPYVAWLPSPDWRLGGQVAWDSGASGWYGDLSAEWSRPLGESAFVTLLGGTSWTSDYYSRSGWNDLFARLSLTYLVNRHVAVTPFVGTSVPTRSGPARERLFGGLWFEVNF